MTSTLIILIGPRNNCANFHAFSTMCMVFSPFSYTIRIGPFFEKLRWLEGIEGTIRQVKPGRISNGNEMCRQMFISNWWRIPCEENNISGGGRSKDVKEMKLEGMQNDLLEFQNFHTIIFSVDQISVPQNDWNNQLVIRSFSVSYNQNKSNHFCVNS